MGDVGEGFDVVVEHFFEDVDEDVDVFGLVGLRDQLGHQFGLVSGHDVADSTAYFESALLGL